MSAGDACLYIFEYRQSWMTPGHGYSHLPGVTQRSGGVIYGPMYFRTYFSTHLSTHRQRRNREPTWSEFKIISEGPLAELRSLTGEIEQVKIQRRPTSR